MKKMLLIIVCVIAVSRLVSAQVSDDKYTVGLWRMNSSDHYTTTSRAWISDYDIVNPSRGNDMVYGISAATASWPQLSQAGQGYDGIGEAMVYSGSQISYGFTDPDKGYGNYDAVRVELWFNRGGNVVGEEALICVGAAAKPWEMRIRNFSGGNRVLFYLHYVEGGVDKVLTLHTLYEEGVWNNVVATVNSYTGEVRLDVTPSGYSTRTDSGTFSGEIYQTLAGSRNGRIYMGARADGADVLGRQFNGMLDSVKVSVIPDTPELIDDARTIALWKMNDEDIFEEYSQIWVKDHDDFNQGRNNNIWLPSDPNAPEIISNTLVFEPGNYAYAPDVWQGYDSAKVELWFYRSSDTALSATGETLLIAGSGGASVFEFRMIQQSVSRLYFFVWDVDNNTPSLNVDFSFDVWNHIVATYDSQEGQMSLAITPMGGEPSVKTSACGNILSATTDIWFGGTRAPGVRPFASKLFLDDVKISILGDTCGLWGYSVADLNKDCVVDTADLAIFATYWLESGWID